MNAEKKTTSLKTSKILLIIGICLLIIGIATTIITSIHFKKSYDDWYQKWFYLKTASINDKPSPFLIIIGGFIIFISIPITFIGLSPYITKASFKLKKETLNYAAKDIQDVGMKTVDITKPIINKEMDEVIMPNINKAVEGIKTQNSNKEVCPQCGDKIDEDEEFCSNCGTKLKEKCPKCGLMNDANNNYCKKCGAKLK